MFSAFSAAPKPMEHSELQALVRDQIIQEAGVDFESRPILAMYSCFFPDPRAANYDDLLKLLLQRLDEVVESDYVLVFFAAGSQYQPGWSFLYRAYSLLGRKYRKNLKSMFIVHPSLWPRLIIQGMGAVVSPKFARKLVWVYSLAQLGGSVPLKQLHVPEAVLAVDAKSSSGKVSMEKLPPDTSSVFGKPLEEIMGLNGEEGLPRVVTDCIEYIRKDGMNVEGIFRRSPASQQLQAAKRAYQTAESTYDLQASGDVHLACVLLKTFFRDLPNPVFSAAMYDTIRGIQSLPTDSARLSYTKNTILPLLPRPTYLLLEATFALLHDIHANSSTNLMTSTNLTIVWAPNLVRSDNPIADFSMGAMGAQSGGAGNVIRICIERFEEVFE
ncbi:Rho GTPase activation protein [Fimicolochytrium jonesii]|uniref:Rho GTPase activation protein n=1 Tax=Fimicolochytrium jonesii TaxID=1396493 RepID=UPI0022FE20C2|nr:Rho GTPase activation protein [Fimicolochytrium jonesii]KAI8821089.1 Rho GTPase activation protein [Fimicolochytrium jonesii]